MLIKAMYCKICGGGQDSAVAMSDVEVAAFEQAHRHFSDPGKNIIETHCIPSEHEAPVQLRAVHAKGEHQEMLAAGARAVTVAEQHAMPGALNHNSEDADA